MRRRWDVATHTSRCTMSRRFHRAPGRVPDGEPADLQTASRAAPHEICGRALEVGLSVPSSVQDITLKSSGASRQSQTRGARGVASIPVRFVAACRIRLIRRSHAQRFDGSIGPTGKRGIRSSSAKGGQLPMTRQPGVN